MCQAGGSDVPGATVALFLSLHSLDSGRPYGRETKPAAPKVQQSLWAGRALKSSLGSKFPAGGVPTLSLQPQGHQNADDCTLHTVQFSSVAQSCPTPCDPMNRSTPGLPVHHQLPEFTQTHVHRVGDAIQPSHPLSSPSTPAPNPSQHHSLFQ